jgi:hypoxanthine-DNA glycosylase
VRRVTVESLPPVAAADARVLILGSMPGAVSLQRSEYYAHPRNRFWEFMDELFGVPRSLAYRDRLAALTARGVALWDVARRCRRRGSADATIADTVPNDIPGLLDRCPGIAIVCCNGKKAEELLRRLVAWPDGAPPFRYLPSTSPANASQSKDHKLAVWHAALAPYGARQSS